MVEDYLRLFVVLILVVGNSSGQAGKPINNPEYLGSPASKAYFFPWLVSIHRESASLSEIFGSGSILTDRWVLASMDSFVRNSRVGAGRPFFQDIENVVLYASGVWGTPYLRENQKGPDWLEKRRALAVYMFSDPDRSKAVEVTFNAEHQPPGLNDLKRSPFGFSMSIALIKTYGSPTSGTDRWIWRRIILPMPLFATQASQLQIRLEDEMDQFEKAPYSLQCYVSGWRPDDYRLVQHKAVYVLFQQCEVAYCAFDPSACHKWPVKGVHVCFQSLTFTDLCWPDQGSALYCEGISKSVIAILTSATTCGFYGLPGVFTLIHHGMALFQAVAGPHEFYWPLKDEELDKYTPPPPRDMFPAYR